MKDLVGLQDIDIVDDPDEEKIDDWSKREVEFDDEQQQSYDQELTKLSVLEWLNEMTSDQKETSDTIQDLDRESEKHLKMTTVNLPKQLMKGSYSFLYSTSTYYPVCE